MELVIQKVERSRSVRTAVDSHCVTPTDKLALPHSSLDELRAGAGLLVAARPIYHVL
jgi:hypothetical protein